MDQELSDSKVVFDHLSICINAFAMVEDYNYNQYLKGILTIYDIFDLLY